MIITTVIHFIIIDIQSVTIFGETLLISVRKKILCFGEIQ